MPIEGALVGDKDYLDQLLAARAGWPLGAAGTPLSDVLGQVRTAETAVRKVADRTAKHTVRPSLSLFFQC
jgi:hypothetical protein